MWIQCIIGIPTKIPQKMILEIDKISVSGILTAFGNYRQMIFTNRSQVQLSHQKNSRAEKLLKRTLVPIVLESIQSSIQKTFYEWDKRDPFLVQADDN